MKRTLLIASVLLFCPSLVSAREYRDPGGVFTIQVPDGWKVERKRDSIGWTTLISSDSHVAKLLVMNGPIPSTEAQPADLKDRLLLEMSRPFFSGWFEGLRQQARARVTQKAHRTRVQSINALQMRVSYQRGDAHDPREGRAIFLLSERNVFFVVLSGSRAGLEAGNKILATWRIAPDR
jgi:hypothetical protein